VGLTQYYTATALDGFIADENHSLDWLFSRDQDRAGPLNYTEFIEELVAALGGRNVWIAGGGDLAGQFADAGLLDEVIVFVAPVTLGRGAPLLPRRLELRLKETARNGDFVTARFSVVGGPSGTQ
jgi:dihydrofolate reductase